MIDSIIFFSYFVIVLIRNYLSCVNRKKDPLLPPLLVSDAELIDLFVLNIYYLLFYGLIDIFNSFLFIPSIFIISSKYVEQYEINFALTLILDT